MEAYFKFQTKWPPVSLHSDRWKFSKGLQQLQHDNYLTSSKQHALDKELHHNKYHIANDRMLSTWYSGIPGHYKYYTGHKAEHIISCLVLEWQIVIKEV